MLKYDKSKFWHTHNYKIQSENDDVNQNYDSRNNEISRDMTNLNYDILSHNY